MPPNICYDSFIGNLLYLSVLQCDDLVLLDEDVYRNHHSHKRQIKPPEKDVGGCVGLLYRFSHATSLILHGLVFTVEQSKNHFTVLGGPGSPQTKACTSNTTLRWEPLSATDSSQSTLSAEGGSGDKERFNSICSERLLTPHVNGISRLHSEIHRSEAQKSRREDQNECCHCYFKFPFGPHRCDDSWCLVASSCCFVGFFVSS